MLSIEYIAGFFDGEGCVSIVRCKRDSQHSGNKGYSLQTDISFVQKDLETLNKIKETLDSYNISSSIQKHSTQNVWILRIRGFNEQMKFCQLFEDKLLLKKSQVILLSEYIKERMRTRWNEHSYAPLTDKELAMYDTMRYLKKNPYQFASGGLS